MGIGTFKFFSIVAFGTLMASCVSAPAETVLASSSAPNTVPKELAPAITDDLQLSLSSSKITDASAVVVTAKLDTRYWGQRLNKAEIRGEFKGVKFQFYPKSLKRGIFEGIFGVGYLFDPGTYDIKVIARIGSDTRKAEVPLTIVTATYKEETLRVSPSKIAPSAKAMKRIMKEKREVGRIYRSHRPERLWKKFERPMKSRLTSRFGNKRLFNGQLQSYHSGIDFRAPVGRPIRVAGDGIVVLAKDLFFTGGTVIVDHGYGIFTLYAHMSKVTTKVGRRVKRGQLLGKAGATGRVSGPHLHWAVIIHNIKVNPEQFLKVMQ